MGYTQSEGQGNADSFIVKLDSNGNKVWMNIIGGVTYDSLIKTVKIETGGYIGCGAIDSSGAFDVLLMRVA